jgi:hypothetical protein
LVSAGATKSAEDKVLGQGFIRSDIAARQLKISGERRVKDGGGQQRRDDSHCVSISHCSFPLSGP